MEKQHLQLIRDDTGTLAEAILTTHPSIASVPVMGTISMGTVVIRVCTEPGFDGCVVSLLSVRPVIPLPLGLVLSSIENAPFRDHPGSAHISVMHCQSLSGLHERLWHHIYCPECKLRQFKQVASIRAASMSK